jgi:hypothetical protein
MFHMCILSLCFLAVKLVFFLRNYHLYLDKYLYLKQTSMLKIVLIRFCLGLIERRRKHRCWEHTLHSCVPHSWRESLN